MELKKIALLTFALILFSTAVVVRFINPVVSYPTETELLMEVGLPVHNIDSGKNFSTIQEAINDDETLDGHTILVDAGTYYEHVTINKSISLIGEDRSTTIIDGSRNGTVISVIADYVNISELTIQNGYHIPHVTYGIKVGEWKDDCNNVTVSRNIISDNDMGIFVYYSSNCVVCDNLIFNNYRGIGIVLSDDNHIEGNSLFNNEEGVTIGSDANNNMIRDNEISNNDFGIHVGWSTGNNIVGNMISLDAYAGIRFDSSSNNSIIGNTITLSNRDGIALFGSNNNTIITNEIIQNKWDGIAVWYSNANIIYNNNFRNNAKQAGSYSGSTNTWDDGYPSGGNYWSNYTGVDVKSGPYQNVTGSDGIGDTPHEIDANNQDRYPLIVPVVWNYSNPIPVVWHGATYSVALSSNSTILTFKFNQPQMQISFDVTGPSGTIGFCNVTIPKSLLKGSPWTVTIDGQPPIDFITTDNVTHTFLYFTYTHSNTSHVIIQGTEVTPEFPTWTSMLLILIVLTVAVAIYKRRLPKTLIH